MRSRLDYDRTDSNISVIGGTLTFIRGFTLNASYGSGKIKKSTVTDSDWITSQSAGLNDLKFSESKSDGRGDTSIFEIGGSVPLLSPDVPYQLGFYLGYFYYEDKITMTNGMQTLANDAACTPLGSAPPCIIPAGTPITGLNSSYDFMWHYIKLGVDGQFKLRKVEFDGGFFLLSLIDYRGEAYWNLRAGTGPGDFRLQPPNFIHKADEGYGLETYLSGSYNFTRQIKLTAGYRYFRLSAENGQDTTYFGDGSFGTADLDSVEAKRHGPYITLQASF